jgi:drug/metabolite transporter (DMT)-like permease
MKAGLRAQLQMQGCVLLWGFTSIVGKLITLSAVALVWWRMLFAVFLLLALPRVRRGLAAMRWRLALAYGAIGGIVALHWVTFYGAIKLANASVAATSIALAPVFVTLVEPLVTKRRFYPRDGLFGLAVLPGAALVLGGIPATMRLGALVGAVSAGLVAVFGALNKRLVHRADALIVTCIELGGGLFALTLVIAIVPHRGPAIPLPAMRDAALLLLLATMLTILPFALSLVALRHMTAFAAQLAVNLEPLYAIALATLLFGEQRELGGAFYAGAAILVGIVVGYGVLSRKDVEG